MSLVDANKGRFQHNLNQPAATHATIITTTEPLRRTTMSRQQADDTPPDTVLSEPQEEQHWYPIPRWSITFGSMAPKTYIDPVDRQHFQSLVYEIHQWSLSAAWVAHELQSQLDRTFELAQSGAGEEWEEEHRIVKRQIHRLVDETRWNREYAQELMDAYARHEYASRLQVLNERLEAAHQQALQDARSTKTSEKQFSDEVTKEHHRADNEAVGTPEVAQHPSSRLEDLPSQNNRDVAGSTAEHRGEQQLPVSEETEDQIALGRVQQRKARREMSPALIENEPAQTRGNTEMRAAEEERSLSRKKKPKKGKFKAERQKAEREIQRQAEQKGEEQVRTELREKAKTKNQKRKMRNQSKRVPATQEKS
jgi:hypothetical protein